MSILNKIFPRFFANKIAIEQIESETVLQETDNLTRILDAIKLVGDNRECVFVSLTTPDYKLPKEVDVEIRSEEFSDADFRIDWNYNLMIELEKLGYYAATREGNKTGQAFSSLFIMVN
jgi:hypothetical protein